MATSSFFYGGSTAPEQNTVDELIDALNQKVGATEQDRVASEQARDRAETAANNAELAESNTAGLASQAQSTLTAAEAAVTSANAAVAGTATNAATATTKAAEASASAAAALTSQTSAATSATNAANSATASAASATTASAQASAAGTSATNAASSASAAAGSATTAATQASNASTSATAAAGSASSASTSATNAASSASAASTSATSASSSASTASTAATSASGSASTATTKAAEASTSASAAATSATNAASSASSASGSASTATTQATNASNSATAAASSASSASTSATNAANSATAAGTSATNAANSATAASGSASAAASSATAAQASQTAAEAAFDSFDDRYLGAKTSAPTADNDGNALLTGALYFNSTQSQMYAWSGSAWVSTGATATGDVVGPASSTDNAIARFDGTTGKLVQNSTASISDTGVLTAASATFNYGSAAAPSIKLEDGRGLYGANGAIALVNGAGQPFLAAQSSGLGATIHNNAPFAWSDSSTSAIAGGGNGLALWRDADQILAQRNGTNPQTFRVYNTYTDASNYERGFVRWNTNVLEIGNESAGTGSLRRTQISSYAPVGSYGPAIDLNFSADAGTATNRLSFGYFGGINIQWGINGGYFGSFSASGFSVGDRQIGFNNGVASNAMDVGFARDSAGVVRVTNGSTGTGSLKASTLDVNGATVSSTTIGNWNTAFGWGNHASAGYITNTGNARVGVENNGTLVGTRRNINFIPGTGISLSIADDAANEEVDVTITSTVTGGVTSIAGTANQVIASASTGAITLSTPQSIGTASSVQFGSLGVGTAASGTTGEIRATNNITAYFSDDRLKTKLGAIDNALDKVRSLSGFYYEPNSTAQSLGYEVKREVGVSAQQVQAVQPEVVAPAPIDDKYLTVRYERLVPLLIEAIKELDLEIQAIKKMLKEN